MAKQATTPTPRARAGAKRSTAKATAPSYGLRQRRRSAREAGNAATGHNLVVVESPAKATTIGRFLGRGYTVKASMGHVRDLPKNKLGVNTDREFSPWYEVPEDKRKVVAEIKTAGENADGIYLATDP